MLHQLAHTGEGAQADDLAVQIFPDLIEGLEPVEELHVLHLRQVPGKDLVEVVVGVHQAGIAEHMGGVNGLIGGDLQGRAHGPDEAILAVEVDLFQQPVLVVAGHKPADVADEQSRHRWFLLVFKMFPCEGIEKMSRPLRAYSSFFAASVPRGSRREGRTADAFVSAPRGSSSSPERRAADPRASCAGTPRSARSA